MSADGLRRNTDLARLAAQLGMMATIRAFEETALDALADGLVAGFIHPSIGQEAVATGVCAQLGREDLVLSTHRGHGHTLAKGADPYAMACELYGRRGGTSNGKGGSMHIADFTVGMLGANGVVAANIVIAAGAAHAVKLRRQDRVVVGFVGDGALNRGPFLEGLNWAAVYGLPVLFVCEDNGWAATTRTRALTAGPGPVARALALGVPARSIDGNDVIAVDEAAGELLAEIRAGGGPRFLHCRTYRLSGHTGQDPAAYRPAEEVAARWAECPIVRLRAVLREAGMAEAELDGIVARSRAAIAAAFARAAEAPWPAAHELTAEVQDLGAGARRA